MNGPDDEGQRKPDLRPVDETDDGPRDNRVAVYTLAGFLGVLAVVVGLIALSRAGGNGDSGAGAHVNLQSGQTNGIALDEREGAEPPEVEEEDLQIAVRGAGCDLREKLPTEGNAHLPEDSPVTEYRTDPPTSGNHIEPPFQQADGAYIDPPGATNVVHALEHGRLALQYSPELPEEEQLELRGLYDTAYAGALFFPNETMPYAVAISSWGELLGCKSYEGVATLDAVRAFGAKYFGTAPEPVEAFGPLVGPTFAEPS